MKRGGSNMVFLALWLTLWVVFSCGVVDSELPEPVASGREVSVKVAFRVNLRQVSDGGCGGNIGGFGADQTQSRSVVNPGTDTDEGTAQGYVPRDVWMMQYGGTQDDAVLVGRPRYVELLETTDVQAVASSSENTLVFVANTHDANMEWGDIGTLAKLKLSSRTITRESDCYGSNLNVDNDLIFSGVYKGVITSELISVELFRNIARLDFTLKNGPASGLTLRNVQLCNVPKDLHYLGGILARDVLFPSMINYFDYPEEAIVGASAPGGAQSFTFYMPVNQRGVVAASTSGKAKSENAPGFSTYFKITALDAQNKAYVYRIYPGANMVNDFNISANHRYAVSLTINAPGDASTDGRVESYGQVDFESSNSFILNPPPMGGKERVFTIPIDKVNEFWPSADATLTIAEGELWSAEVIWQDTPDPNFIRFNDPATGLPATTMQGSGPDQRICLAINSASEGNALVGLKKVGREEVGYLWSWHVWVTPYDPSYKGAPVPDQFVYSVPHGALHRYQGAGWTSPTGRYHNSYIMDRNLGARDPNFTSVGALYYQFGRKDPLPCIGYGNVLYDINGVALSASDIRNATTMNKNTGKGVTLATGVLNPTYFYYRDQVNGFGDWTNESRAKTHMWNNTVEGVDLKSVFDPCPTGWKVPVNGIWLDFAYNQNDPALSTTLHRLRDEKLAWNRNNITGGRYWPKNRKVEGSIYYPALGCRYITTGTNVLYSDYVYHWTSSTDDASWAYYFGITSGGVHLGGAVKTHGFSVRCVRE